MGTTGVSLISSVAGSRISLVSSVVLLLEAIACINFAVMTPGLMPTAPLEQCSFEEFAMVVDTANTSESDGQSK